ncbi:transmembrane and immunoglobulin domain-containing protein 2-like isoform X1 [Scleropages formosus]|uniref:transmembrane and immunoglobulin domain-containing protein 2-like isoform X1 n=1 Tax=Scleropages formosus TaxID=113540 RepID=UPI00087870E3|nr:transmembrane and immunoglobulin domain-containing protein 2-like isoform X1 [Scleropages formosus]
MKTFAVPLDRLLLSLPLSLLCIAGSGEALDLIQSPVTLTAMEGEQVRIQCCWQDDCSFERVRVKWTKSNISLGDNVLGFDNQSTAQNAGKCYRTDASGNCSKITLSNVTTNDSGLYVCEVTVEIPSLHNGRGGGTRVEIRVKHDTTDARGSSPTGLGVAVPLAVALAVLSSAAVFCQWRRRRLRALHQGGASGRVGLVIQESPRGAVELDEMNTMAEMAEAGDRNSNSSRGSAQWCPVQLYESIDYFDVKTDGSS